MSNGDIIVLSRSKELNGISEIKRSLPKLSDRFITSESVFGLVAHLLAKPNIQCIFALSGIEAIIAICLTQLLRKKIPIVMAVYHSKQWLVGLDADYSPTQAMLFSKILPELPATNIIYNSVPVYNACMAIFNVPGDPCFVLPPSSFTPPDKLPLKKKSTSIRIVTVGRYVDFKVKGILHFIECVDRLNSQGCEFTYDIYGEGPLKDSLVQKISETRNQAQFTLHNALPPDQLATMIGSADLYFGMGITISQAALLGVPTLISIQDSEKTYGFFSWFNHSINPVIGDALHNAEMLEVEELLIDFSRFSDTQRQELGQACQTAAAPYLGERTVQKLLQVLLKAPYIKHTSIRLIQLFFILLEKKWFRFCGRKGIQA